jgi:predicted TPR repeat methyltransferase
MTPDEAMRLAGEYVKKGNPGAAAGLYQSILAHLPQHRQAREALQTLQQSAGLQNSMRDDLAGLLQLYQAGNLERATSEAQRLCDVYPDQPLPPNILGAIEATRGNHLKAVEYYQRALAIQPDFLGALNNLGVACERLGRYDEAIDCFRRVLAGRSDDAQVHSNLGSALRHTGQLPAAVESYRRSLSLRPSDARTHVHLGLALREMSRLREAIAAFTDALRYAPDLADAHEFIGDASVDLAQRETAEPWYRKSIMLAPDRAGAHFKLGKVLLEQGQRGEAVASLERALELEPECAETRHFLAAAQSGISDTAPREYVSTLFDGYAARFDEHLVKGLEYTAPKQLWQLVSDAGVIAAPVERAIDLGCGTGLVGVAFRGLCQHLVGVDLSAKMIDQATRKQVYDALHEGDVVDFLQQTDQTFDLFLSADTLIYIGYLSPLLQAIGARSRQGSLLAFTTESAIGTDVELRPSGRFAQSREYVLKTAADAGFELLHFEEMNLRKEGLKWIPGGYYLMVFRG